MYILAVIITSTKRMTLPLYKYIINSSCDVTNTSCALNNTKNYDKCKTIYIVV